MGGASIDACGEPLTDDAIATAKAADAVLMGSIGGNTSTSPWYKLPPHPDGRPYLDGSGNSFTGALGSYQESQTYTRQENGGVVEKETVEVSISVKAMCSGVTSIPWIWKTLLMKM